MSDDTEQTELALCELCDCVGVYGTLCSNCEDTGMVHDRQPWKEKPPTQSDKPFYGGKELQYEKNAPTCPVCGYATTAKKCPACKSNT